MTRGTSSSQTPSSLTRSISNKERGGAPGRRPIIFRSNPKEIGVFTVATGRRRRRRRRGKEFKQQKRIPNATNPKNRKSSLLVEQAAHHLMASSNQQQVQNRKELIT